MLNKKHICTYLIIYIAPLITYWYMLLYTMLNHKWYSMICNNVMHITYFNFTVKQHAILFAAEQIILCAYIWWYVVCYVANNYCYIPLKGCYITWYSTYRCYITAWLAGLLAGCLTGCLSTCLAARLPGWPRFMLKTWMVQLIW